MAKTSWLLSCTALISLSGSLPGAALEITQEEVALLREHWELCHPEFPVPEDHRLIRNHGPFYDEDHFELFMQEVRAHSCDNDTYSDGLVPAPVAGGIPTLSPPSGDSSQPAGSISPPPDIEE